MLLAMVQRRLPQPPQGEMCLDVHYERRQPVPPLQRVSRATAGAGLLLVL